MRLLISGNHLEYDLEFHGKYTVIWDDSGTGKSVMCRLIAESAEPDSTVVVNCEKKVYAVNSIAECENVMVRNDCVIVIDEFSGIFRQRDIAKRFKDSNNYFILITRLNLSYLPISTENICHFVLEGNRHWLAPLHVESKVHTFSNVKYLVTEDEKSSFKFLKLYFPNLRIISAKSKTRIIDTLQKLIAEDNDFNNVLIVVDVSSFGYYWKPLCEKISELEINVQFLDWQSFEHYLLTQEPINITLTSDEVGYRYESLEEAAEIELKKVIHYNKASLSHCICGQPCGNCHNSDFCEYQSRPFKFDLVINDCHCTNHNETLYMSAFGWKL